MDVSKPTTVVGTGVASSCTEQALERALQSGGIITFDCGGPATIGLTTEKQLRTDVDTTIDGGGVITIDGGGKTRLFHFQGPDYRKSLATATFQNIELSHGKATGTAIVSPAAPTDCSRGFHIDGGGGAIYVQDGVLHVINVTFRNNNAGPLGPDVGGGGIYAAGARQVIVVRSRFLNGSGSNGGGIGSLNSDLKVFESTFVENSALGRDGNYDDSSCPEHQRGSGGSGAAIYIDGGSDLTATFCGDTFLKNRGGENAFGGAIFRTADLDKQTTLIEQSTFDSNQGAGGGALYFHNSDLRIIASTFSNNTATQIGGALQADGTTLTVDNSTFFNNRAAGPWGVFAFFSGEGHLRNCTFAGNQSSFAPLFPDFTSMSASNCIFLMNHSVDGSTGCSNTNVGTANLQWPDPGATGGNSASGCLTGVTLGDPKLGELADNGGPTRTLLPQLSEPLSRIGRDCPGTDQRNRRRPDVNACTPGSVQI